MKAITLKEAGKKIGKSLSFYRTFLERGNKLYFISNPFGICIYALIPGKPKPEGVVESTLKNGDECDEWDEAAEISGKDLMNDHSLLRFYPEIIL